MPGPNGTQVNIHPNPAYCERPTGEHWGDPWMGTDELEYRLVNCDTETADDAHIWGVCGRGLVG